MSAPAALRESFRQMGIVLFLEGNGLGFDAPKGVMTETELGLLRAHKPGLVALLREEAEGGQAGEIFRSFRQTHGAALQAAGWGVERVWSDFGLYGLLQAGGRLEDIRPWRIVFRGAEGTRRALLLSGRWLEEAALIEMEQEEFFTLAGRFMSDGVSQEEADTQAAQEIER